MGTSRGKATSGDPTQSRVRKAKRARETKLGYVEAAREPDDGTELARDSQLARLATESEPDPIEAAYHSEVDQRDAAEQPELERVKTGRESEPEQIGAAEETEAIECENKLGLRAEFHTRGGTEQLGSAQESELEQPAPARRTEVGLLEPAPEMELDGALGSELEQVEADQESDLEQTEPAQESDVDHIEPAQIENPSAQPEVPFENLVQHSRRLSDERVRSILESVLFVADRPLTVNDLRACTGLRPSRIQAGMESLAAARREGAGGTVLYEVAGGWQLRTDPANAEYVRRFLRVKPQRLTRAAVETLAIIAYRQPVTRPEIEDIRGVDSGAVVSALLDRKLIKILGRKEEVGRPILYGTTREFLEFFALKDLASLPTLREFQELTDEHRELVETEAPPPAVSASALDPKENAAVDELGTESDEALAELDLAIASADERSKATAAFLAASQSSPEEQEEPSNAP